MTRFLDFARPLHADLTPQGHSGSARSRLERCGAVLEGRAGCEWRKNYQANLPLVPLDESLCEQAFVNIIQNAYDAMSDSGGGRLRVRGAEDRGRTATRETASTECEVRIADTGPGIPAELREQIFNPFVTTKKSGRGTGTVDCFEDCGRTSRLDPHRKPSGARSDGPSGVGHQVLIFRLRYQARHRLRHVFPGCWRDRRRGRRIAHLVIS